MAAKLRFGASVVGTKNGLGADFAVGLQRETLEVGSNPDAECSATPVHLVEAPSQCRNS